mgnify:CR=1 FL=1
MMPKRYIQLTDSDKANLEEAVRTSSTFRVRRRSQALLWSFQGKDRATIAELLDVRLDTVSDWFNRWTNSVESLVDLPKSGRPSILSTAEKKSN